MKAHVIKEPGEGWAVIFDGWDTPFVTETMARKVAAQFERGIEHPTDYWSDPIPEWQK